MDVQRDLVIITVWVPSPCGCVCQNQDTLVDLLARSSQVVLGLRVLTHPWFINPESILPTLLVDSKAVHRLDSKSIFLGRYSTVRFPPWFEPICIYMHGSPEVSSSKVLDPVDTEEEWRKCDSSGGFPSAGCLVPKELRSRRDSITTLAIVG